MRTCTVIEGCNIKIDPWRFSIQHIMFHNRENISLFGRVTDLFHRTFKKHLKMGFAVTNYYIDGKEKNLK